MTFPVKISFIIFILHCSFILQQVKCWSMFAKQAVNLMPSDDACPGNSLCENPPGYPKEHIRQELLKNRNIRLRPVYDGSAYYSPESAYAPENGDTVNTELRSSFLSIPRLGSNASRTVQVYSTLPSKSDTDGDYPSTRLETSPVSKEQSLFSSLKKVQHFYAPQNNITNYNYMINASVINDVRSGSLKPDLCPSLIKTIRPKSGTSVENERLFIVNEEEILIQEIDIEICGATIEEVECRFIEPLGNARAVCKQKHIKKELIVLRQNGKLESVAMKIPSHCCCDIMED